MGLRSRIGKRLRVLADRWAPEQQEPEEPKRTGLEKMLITSTPDVKMPDASVPPLVLDVMASTTGHPGSFVNFPQPGDYGVLWERDTSGLR